MKKEIPILFSTPMVKAILDKIKTQTRRVKSLELFNQNPDAWEFIGLEVLPDGQLHAEFKEKSGRQNIYTARCPYGKVGDVLWVRERWNYITNTEGERFGCYHSTDVDINNKWRPSIHMPKSAARIWLQVEDVRVERLQDISDEDALAEGIEVRQHAEEETLTVYRDYLFKERFAHGTNFKPRNSFATLWQSINGRDSWKANPWVWVVSFKILSTTGKPDYI